MKLKLLSAFLFLISFQTFAQDQKWSVEANYSAIPADGFGGDDDIFELGLKYRFADFEFANLGFSLNSGFSRETSDNSNISGSLKSYYFQPRVFSEFRIPKMNRLRLSLGIGYSVISANSSLTYVGEAFGADNTTNGGFNFNIGLSYDITKNFFVQAQYDFINLRVRDEYTLQGEVIKPDYNYILNNVKIGIGFRF